jgi:ribosome-associated protein
MLRVSRHLAIPERELRVTAVRASGPGGQHVNKAATAVQLRFDVRGSPSLPVRYKERLLTRGDHRLTRDGVIVIKAQEHRSRERNEAEARERLRRLLEAAGRSRPARRPTAPTLAARRRRLETKKRRGHTKALRKPPAD